MRPSFPLLKPPLGVWGVFGGTKTPKHQLNTELEIQKHYKSPFNKKRKTLI